MSPKLVEAVWCIPITQANYRAAYGRIGGGNEFTKDYFQISGDAYRAMVKLLMGGNPDVSAEVEYVWPGGSVKDAIRRASDEERLRLSWPYGSAPTPWKPTKSPSDATASTFPGDPEVFQQPGLNQADAAATVNQQWKTAEAAGIRAWALAIKLRGEEGKLHARMYLLDPPPGYEWASVDLLPPPLQRLIRNGKSSALVHVFKRPVRARRLVKQILDALDGGSNVLLAGPPGTGKTVALEDLRALKEGTADHWAFDPEKNHDAWVGRSNPVPFTKTVSLVFHPGYTYENFVLGVFPDANVAGGITVVPGPLLELAHYAEEGQREALLIIDEFNRGQAAAIFGDTLALLDEDKRSDLQAGTPGAQITRRYSSQRAVVSPTFRRGKTDTGEIPAQISLPRTLSIIAAMNSSDRSVAALDSAMRRRFSIIEVGPDYEALAEHFDIDPAADLPDAPAGTADVQLLAYRLLQSINQRIKAISGPDFELGQSLVWKVAGDDMDEAMDALAHAVDQRVIATLRMSYRDDPDNLGAILRAPASSGVAPDPDRFASWVDAPAELDNFAERSLFVTPLVGLDPAKSWALLKTLV